MDHALAMRSLQRFANLDAHTQKLRSRHRTLLDAFRERLALQIFHDEIIGAVLPSDIVERADIGMVEARDCAGFTFEPLSNLRSVGQMQRQNLEGDSAIKPRIARAVHFAHSTRTDRCDDFVGPKASSASECHSRGLYASRVARQGTKLSRG